MKLSDLSKTNNKLFLRKLKFTVDHMGRRSTVGMLKSSV